MELVRAALRKPGLLWATRRECRRWDLKGSAGLPRRTVDCSTVSLFVYITFSGVSRRKSKIVDILF
jgi:hypothetical protein